MRRHAGSILIVVGLIHVLLFSVLHRHRYAAIIRDGIVNTVDGDVEREAAFWTMAFGLLLLMVGSLMRSIQTRGGRLPTFPGWAMLGMGLAGGILMPASPFWLFVPLGLGIVRRPRSVEAEAAPDPPPADVRDADSDAA